ncbi:hypothetical protein [Chroococcidiopsis cubana]|uniref:hypothetical protein n=1 Tax=Chroococcidiopsis cubana TaxID=171392 RepID=UPI002ACE791F|nr:hypothetical protein [Chroococcidiopsis cubana]
MSHNNWNEQLVFNHNSDCRDCCFTKQENALILNLVAPFLLQLRGSKQRSPPLVRRAGYSVEKLSRSDVRLVFWHGRIDTHQQ